MRFLSTLFSQPLWVALLALLAFIAPDAGAQTPASWQWGLQSTNPIPTDRSTARGNAVATDAAGRVYVGGAYLPENGLGNARRSFGSAGTLAAGRGGFVAQAGAAGQWNWVTEVSATGPGAGNPGYATVTGISVASTGDVYATGVVQGASVRVGTQTQALGASGYGLFVARLSSTGVCQALYLAEGNFTTVGLAPDPSTGGMVVVSLYQGVVVFGSLTLTAGNASGNSCVAVARLNAAGQWSSAASAIGQNTQIWGSGFAVGPAGQVAFVGELGGGTISFGSTALAPPAFNTSAFMIAQLSPTNQWQWALGGRSGTHSGAFAAAYTASGALWVAGWGTQGTAVGGTTLAAISSGSTPGYTGFMGQLSPAGQWGTVQAVPTATGGLVGFGLLKVDGAGNAVAMGSLRNDALAGQATLGGQALASPPGGILLYVASLSSAGQWRYVAAVPQPAFNYGFLPIGMALDGGGNLYLTGGLRGALTLGSSALLGSDPGTMTSDPYGDVVLGKLGNATPLARRAAGAVPALACFPNPAHTQATLRLPAGSTATTVSLTNVLGQVVAHPAVPAGASTATLDLTGLAPGLYVVRCGAASGRLVVE